MLIGAQTQTHALKHFLKNRTRRGLQRTQMDSRTRVDSKGSMQNILRNSKFSFVVLEFQTKIFWTQLDSDGFSIQRKKSKNICGFSL